MSPTSSSRLLAGRNARSATPRTINLPRLRRATAYAVGRVQAPNATHARRNWRSICPMRVLSEPMRYIRARMRSRSAIARRSRPCSLAGCGGGAAPGRRRARRAPTSSRSPARSSRPRSRSPRTRAMIVPRPQRRHEGGAERRRDGRDRPVARRAQGTVAFGQRVDDSRLSDPERPVWVVNEGPRGGDSAATNTWALGRLGAGRDQDVHLEGHRRRARRLHDPLPHLPRPHRQGEARRRRPHRRALQGHASTTSRSPRAWTTRARSCAARRRRVEVEQESARRNSQARAAYFAHARAAPRLPRDRLRHRRAGAARR